MHSAPKPPAGPNWLESKPDSLRGRADILKKLASYKDANPLDLAYYVRVVKASPARAVDMLLYKDMLRHEGWAQLVDEVMPELTKLYGYLEHSAKIRIDERVGRAAHHQKQQTFVNEVLREVSRHCRRTVSRGHDGRE